MTPSWLRRLFAPVRLADAADRLAIAVAVLVPWSTSGAGIAIALWLVAVIPLLNFHELWRSARHPAVGLPLVFAALAIAGIAWSEVSFNEAVRGVVPFLKVAAIALLVFQFRRSDRGIKVALAFLLSCTALLVASWIMYAFPSIPPLSKNGSPGIPVHDYIVQSGEFLLCAFALAHLAWSAWSARRLLRAALLAALGFAFLANIVFVATSRTSLAIFFPLVVIFGLQRFRWAGMAVLLIVSCVVAASAAALSPYMRNRIVEVVKEVNDYEQHDAGTSSGYRLTFWKKSLRIIQDAPIIGHGTGSIEEMFRRDAVGRTGMAAEVTANPHNQIFNIGIQLGAAGVAVLFAMWLAHGLLFCRAGPAAWIGLAVVVQNIISSLTNSQLFYFAPGWLYVFGVGVLGGTVLRNMQPPPGQPQG